MSESKHTPGPWDVEGNLVRSRIVWDGEKTRGGILISEARDRYGLPHSDEAKANARLIAAAPCLLAVAECEEALDMPMRDGWPVLERYGWRAEDRFALPAAEFVRRLRRAALARARGEHQ